MPRPNDSFLDWLQVLRSAKGHIPHYSVLGLEMFEDDPGRIRQAVQRQVKALWNHTHGPYAHEVRQARQLVDRASRHLLNTRLKAEYDAKLKAEYDAKHRASLAVPQVVSIQTISPVSERLLKAERDTNRMLIISSCAAMACIATVLIYTFWPKSHSFSPVTVAQYEAEEAEKNRVLPPPIKIGNLPPMQPPATKMSLTTAPVSALPSAAASVAATKTPAPPAEPPMAPAAAGSSDASAPRLIVGEKTIEIFPAETRASVAVPETTKPEKTENTKGENGKNDPALVTPAAPPSSIEAPPTPRLAGPPESLWKAAVNKVRCVAVAADGRSVVTGGWDHTIRWWDLETGKEMRRWNGHRDNIYDVAICHDGKSLASCSADGRVLVCSIKGQDEPKILEGHQGTVHRVAFLNRSNRLASVGNDQTIRIWNLDDGKEETCIKGNDRWLTLAISADDEFLLAGGREGHLSLWSLRTGKLVSSLEGHQGAIHSAAFLGDGAKLISAGWDGSVRLWDRESTAELQRFEGAGMGQVSLTVSPDGTRFATGGEDGRISLWDIETARQLATYDGHRERVGRIAFQPGSGCMVSAGWDDAVRFWQTP